MNGGTCLQPEGHLDVFGFSVVKGDLHHNCLLLLLVFEELPEEFSVLVVDEDRRNVDLVAFISHVIP